MRKLWTGLPLAAALMLVPAAPALAVKDGVYTGTFKDDSTATVELTVSGGGDDVAGQFSDVLFKCNDGSKFRSDFSFSGLRIRDGEFFIKASNPVEVRGEFDGKRVSGTFLFKEGGCKNRHTEWKARLENAG